MLMSLSCKISAITSVCNPNRSLIQIQVVINCNQPFKLAWAWAFQHSSTFVILSVSCIITPLVVSSCSQILCGCWKVLIQTTWEEKWAMALDVCHPLSLPNNCLSGMRRMQKCKVRVHVFVRSPQDNAERKSFESLYVSVLLTWDWYWNSFVGLKKLRGRRLSALATSNMMMYWMGQRC